MFAGEDSITGMKVLKMKEGSVLVDVQVLYDPSKVSSHVTHEE